MKQIGLIIKSKNDFRIIDGKLKSNKAFNVKIIGDNMIISNNSCENNQVPVLEKFENISISQHMISFNGYELTIKDGILHINGIKYGDEVITTDEKEFFEYPFEEVCISSVEIVFPDCDFVIEDMSIFKSFGG